MGRPYHEKYANVKWETSEKHFQAWKEGRTGVPIVDAAMRQMNVFGTSSSIYTQLFIIYAPSSRLDAQPLQDDRSDVPYEGFNDRLEAGRTCAYTRVFIAHPTDTLRTSLQYFSQNLLDGDLASNNGGWQWAASTGTDAQPYFRVFNPVSQSTKCDPDGAYLRRYVTELAKVKGKGG